MLPFLRPLIALCVIAGAITPALAQPSAAEDPGMDHAMLDTKMPACQNFYRFACGGWVDANPIPADESSWRVDQLLSLRNLETLRAILEKAASDPTPDTIKIGNYYAACMDTAKMESLGLEPLRPGMNRIATTKSKDGLPQLIAELHRIGVSALFSFGSGQDAKDAEAEIAVADEGGMGLPDRDYYLKTDARTRKIRDQYQAHIARMFVLAGTAEADAEGNAKTALAIETALAKGALDRVARRDPQQTYHLLDRTALGALTLGFDWSLYLGAIGAPPVKSVDVTEPKFFEAAARTITQTSLEDLKTYLTWRLIDGAAPWLTKGFVDENFAFDGKVLTGATEIKPQWKRCVGAVDMALGEDLGRAYVADAFPPQAKARTEAMVDAIARAFEADLKSVDWMSPETHAKAITKLGQMRRKIGYPDHWRDYGPLLVSRHDMLGNEMRAAGFEMDRELGKIGKPVDHGEWEITPPTVNAYYDPQMNDINLPAGILQPPFFSPRYDDAIDYGATGGGTVGHEMTHGFDDEGRQYDGHGNLVDWWTKDDAARFGKRAQCVVDQYSGYTAVDKIHVNGKLTLGENVADLGGVRLGYAALIEILAGKPPPAPIGGFTPAQRYFSPMPNPGAVRPGPKPCGCAP